MSKRGKKKKKGMGTVIFLSLVVVVCAVVLIRLVCGNLAAGIKSAVTEQFMEQTFQKALESVGDPQAAAKAKEIVDQMDEADKKEVEAIIDKYANEEALSNVMEIMRDGVNSESLAQVEQYMQNRLSDEDIDKLQELYEKYVGE